MESDWNFFPFDTLSQELRVASKTMHAKSAMKKRIDWEQ